MILAAQKIKRNQLPRRNPTTASSNTKGKVPPWVLIKRTLCRIMNIIFMGLNNEQLISILIENVQQNIWVILGIPGEVPMATCLKWQLPIPFSSSVSSHNTCHQLVFYLFESVFPTLKYKFNEDRDFVYLICLHSQNLKEELAYRSCSMYIYWKNEFHELSYNKLLLLSSTCY